MRPPFRVLCRRNLHEQTCTFLWTTSSSCSMTLVSIALSVFQFEHSADKSEALDRTTNGKGLIREQNWHGENGMEHLRTVKKPEQSIPTFAETVALLMKVSRTFPRPRSPHADTLAA